MANPWDDAYGSYTNSLRSGNTSKEKIQELYGGLSPEFAQSIIKIKGEIDQQKKAGTADYWGAGNLASPDAAAWDAAFRLAEKGVGSLYDLKQENGETINTKTGQQLQGFGNAYNHDLDFHITYNKEGLPVLTAANQKSEWVDKYRAPVTAAALMALGYYGPEMFAGAAGAGTGAGTGALVSAGEAAAVGSTIGTGTAASTSLATQIGTSLGFSGPTATAVGNSIIQGGISEATGGDFVKGAVGSYVGGQLAGNLTSTLGSTGANLASRVATSALTGGDPVQALISGGIGAAVPLITAQVPGFDTFGPATQKAINNTVASAIASGGDISPDMLVRAGLTAAKDYVATSGPDSKDFIAGYFAPGGEGYIAPPTYAPDTKGYFDELTGRFVPDDNGSLTFGQLTNETSGTNIGSMDDYKYNPDTGNWTLPDGTEIDTSYMQNSKMPLTGQQVLNNAGAGGPKTPGKPSTPQKPGAPANPSAGMDINQLMSLLGGGQQAAPTVVSSGQDNSADVQLMEDIFGPTMSAPPAGDSVTQARELARLLRS
jgi:hypothetical protein